MTKKVFLAGVILLSVLFFIVLIPNLQNPLLYQKTPREYSTKFHEDPGLYQKTDLNSSGSSLVLMQEMLDISGPVTLNIRIDDPEAARKDLREYKSILGRMNNLIIKVEMNQTDIARYVDAHKDNEQILSDLLNETGNLDQLRQLEVQFTDQNDPGSFTSVVYKETAIKKKVRELYERYNHNTEIVNNTSSKYSLDTTSYQESVKTFETIVNEQETEQELVDQQVLDLKPSFKNSLTIVMSPLEGYYGDSFTISGNLQGTDNNAEPVQEFVDGVLVNRTATSQNGRYEFHYTIDRVQSGTHTVYTLFAGVPSVPGSSTISDPVTFEVLPVSSAITLYAVVNGSTSKVICTGSILTSQNVPMSFVPVTLTWDAGHQTEVLTNEQGSYKTNLTMTEGNHTIQASFRGEGYPVYPSLSSVVTINVTRNPGKEDSPVSGISLLVRVGIMALAIGGAVFYIRRKRIVPLPRKNKEGPLERGAIDTEYEKAPGPGSDKYYFNDDDMESPQEDRIGEKGVSIFRRFSAWVSTFGFRVAAYRMFRHLLLRMGKNVARSRTLTAREIAIRSKEKPYYPVLSKFITVYERIRYGPEPYSEDEKAQFKNDATSLNEALGDEKGD